MRQQLMDLQCRYETLSNRIAALDKDLGRILDSEHKLTLQQRRQDLVAERNQEIEEMAQIERQLPLGIQITAMSFSPLQNSIREDNLDERN